MGAFDAILNQLGNHSDVANMAGKLGIDPAMAEVAIAALGKSHAEPGDTVELAAQKTGMDTGILSQIVQQVGGEGSLGEFARMLDTPQAASVLKMLDRDGDGSALDDIAGMASGIFGKK